MTSRLLAIDTATEACSVAVWQRSAVGSAEGHVMASRHAIAPRGHTQLVLPMVQSVLQEANWQLSDIEALVCTRGPGSFTGVRVGVSAGQGLAFALNLPVLAMSTLYLLAWQGHLRQPQIKHWQVAMDARMGEVYWAEYRLNDDPGAPWLGLGEEQLLRPEDAPVRVHASIGHVGTGWALPLMAKVPSALADTLPDAAAMASLAGRLTLNPKLALVSAEALQPVYLRDNVTHQAKKQ